MEDLFWTPVNASGFASVVAFGIALLYLLLLPNKTRETRLLLFALVVVFIATASTVYFDLTVYSRIISAAAFQDVPWLAFSDQIIKSVFPLAMLILAYRSRFRYAIIEERVVVTAVAVVQAVLLWQIGKGLPDVAPDQAVRIQLNIFVNTIYLWIAVVAARKLFRAYRKRADVETKRMMLILFVALVGLLFLEVAKIPVNPYGIRTDILKLLSIVGSAAFGGALFIGALLFGGERHSVLAKLLGFILISYVLILNVLNSVSNPASQDLSQFAGSPDRSTIIIDPEADGSYSVTTAGPRWVVPVGPLQTTENDDDGALAISSTMPIRFYGTEYDSLWVGTNGVISFGDELDGDRIYRLGEGFYNNTPSIAPLYADLVRVNLQAGMQIDQSDSMLVISWTRMNEFYREGNILTFQTVLHSNGRIEFNYKTIPSWPEIAFVGITPGGRQTPTNFLALNGLGGESSVGAIDSTATMSSAGAAQFVFRDTRLAFRQFLAPRSFALAKIYVLCLLLFLGIGYLFYRVGLVTPLKKVLSGVSQVASGNLNAEVKISERNELGAIADHFSEMTESLREYAHKMEELVADRTADLDATVKDLHRTQSQLIQQEKLASLGSLTAGIAHEIKNPLNFVNNFAELNEELADELRADLAAYPEALANVESTLEDIKQNASVIAQHGKRADRIVKNMMAHARDGKGERTAVDLNALVDEYVEHAYHGKRANRPDFNIHITRDFDESVGTVDVIADDFGRVILNIFDNAFDALRAHSESLTGETVATFEPTVRIVTRRNGDFVEIRISDNGPGIPAEVREKIFEPFFTTKPTGSGTGLGLSLSYDIIVQGHGGTMSVTSEPGAGSEFEIVLPVRG